MYCKPTSSLDVDRLVAGVGWHQGLPLALLECPLVLWPGALHGVGCSAQASEAGYVLNLGLHVHRIYKTLY